MTIRVLDSQFYVRNMRTRFPFRYGIASMTALPHLFVHLLIEVDGVEQWGIASDGLAPKWFTKNADQPFEQEIEEMLAVIQSAVRFAGYVSGAKSVFDLWRQVYAAQCCWAHDHDYPPLLWNFGVSLVERAVLDAYCRVTGVTFADALRSNSLGIHLGQVDGDLAGFKPGDLLPEQPLRSLIARHTVGLADPLTDDEIGAEDRVDDGLPHSLDASIRAYGLTHFKLKLGGDINADIERLTRIADVVDNAVDVEYALTIDGNEQYTEVAAFRELWEALNSNPALARFLEQLIFVEQPLKRTVALSDTTQQAMLAWTDRPPIIIDESDAGLTSLPRALACGYVGTSHKNCKGVFKGIINACRLAKRNQELPGQPVMLSSEDLSNVGPVALLQDLAVAASLGITHLERNGHHYFRGLSMYETELQQQVLNKHPDLYRRHEDGFAAVSLTDGCLDVGSVVDAPFGIGFELDPTAFTPLAEWQFSSLDNPAIEP
jgi:hypothetical protein